MLTRNFSGSAATIISPELESIISSSSSSSSSGGGISPTPNGWDADDEGSGRKIVDKPTRNMSASGLPKRDTNPNFMSIKRPSLKEILANTSSPPWTLTAFMAYLSNNHCLETLEFTMDATRYKKHYAKLIAKTTDKSLTPGSKEASNLKILWQRLIEAYIRPNGSREINVPSEVRDPILKYDYAIQPPTPDILDDAVQKVYELMEESVLVPFLETMSPRHIQSPADIPSICPECGMSVDDTYSSSSTTEDNKSSSSTTKLFRRSAKICKHHTPTSTTSTLTTDSSTNSSPVMIFPITSSSSSTASNRKSIPSSLNTTLYNNKHYPQQRLSPTSLTSTPPLNVTSATLSCSEMSSAPALTDDSGYTSSHTNESIMTPPMSPPDSDVPLSPQQSRESIGPGNTSGNVSFVGSVNGSLRESGAWKRLSRLSHWKLSRKRSEQVFPGNASSSKVENRDAFTNEG